MRLVGVLFVLLLSGGALGGCHTPGEVRLVRIPPPPPPPPTIRCAVTTTATVATGTSPTRRVELRVPLLGDEPEAQTVELTSVRITPALPSRIESDASGNRVLRVDARGAASVGVTVTAHVRRTAVRVDLQRVEERALTDLERHALEGEMDAKAPPGALALESAQRVLATWAAGEATDAVVARLRARGFPARPVRGLALGERASPVTWLEVYLPGLAWVPAAPGLPFGVLPERVLSLTRGALPASPSARVDGAATAPASQVAARFLD